MGEAVTLSAREAKDLNRFGESVHKALLQSAKNVNDLAMIVLELAERVEELEEYVASTATDTAGD